MNRRCWFSADRCTEQATTTRKLCLKLATDIVRSLSFSLKPIDDPEDIISEIHQNCNYFRLILFGNLGTCRVFNEFRRNLPSLERHTRNLTWQVSHGRENSDWSNITSRAKRKHHDESFSQSTEIELLKEMLTQCKKEQAAVLEQHVECCTWKIIVAEISENKITSNPKN